VGLGDYVPRNNEERLLGVVFLFSGVAIFTFLAGKLTKNLSTYQDLKANFDDGETLMMFFGTLRNFNENKSITLWLKKDIESYFDYKWNNDRNIAFQTDSEKKLMQKLPKIVQDRLYKEFLFTDFVYTFS
jgi:hypothetical protein